MWRGTSKLAFWSIKRRYSDFDALNAALRVGGAPQNGTRILIPTLLFLLQPSGLELPLPPKKVFKNKDRLFIAERQKALDVIKLSNKIFFYLLVLSVALSSIDTRESGLVLPISGQEIF